MASARKVYRQSPIGIARYCWVNKPDVKFNADGVYKTDLVLEGEEAEAFRAELEAASQEAFEEITGEMPAGVRKKWSVYFPFVVEEDEDNGNPTGRIIFRFKQNAKIRLKDGEVKHVKIGLRDSRNKVITTNVFGGSTIRVLFATRPIKLETAKQAGVKLDFSMVQLIKASESSGGGFDEVEGGYVDDGEDEGRAESNPNVGEGADY